jgi:hypothetical protein
VRELLKAFQAELNTIEISSLNDQFFILASQASSLKNIKTQDFNTINIAPCLDPYLMGYKNRDRYLDQNIYNYVYDLSGNATTTILHKGRVIGIWDLEAPLFKYFLFSDLNKDALNNLKVQAAKVGRFISGKEIRLKACKSMKPLGKRTGSGVGSPLKET